MSHQIAIPIHNGEITALVTYHFPKPYEVQIDHYSNPRIWIIRQNSVEKMRHKERDQVIHWLETQRPGIAMPARISNIEFLMASYEPKALKIYGSELSLIEREIAKIPPFKYETAENLLEDCTPNYDF